MTRVALPLLAMMALGGCYSAPANTAQGQCERAAGNDPAVAQAQEDAGSELAGVRGEALIRERALRHEFMQKCLTRLGAAPSGGVTPVAPGYYSRPPGSDY